MESSNDHSAYTKFRFDIQELRELRNIEDPAPVNVTALQEEVDHFTQQIDRLQRKKDALEQQNQTVKEEMAEAERNFQEIADRISTLANSSDPINVSKFFKIKLIIRDYWCL